MEIQSTVPGKNGAQLPVFYRDVDSEKDFAGIKIDSVRVYCLKDGKLVVVHEPDGSWGLPGGTVDEGESVWDAVRREVFEETSLALSDVRLVSIQKVVFPEGPAYHVVRAVGVISSMSAFKGDPAGEVTETKLIDPAEIIPLADAHWGKMADRMLERTLELNDTMLCRKDAGSA